MYTIYSNASQVLVWLGESDDDIDQAMHFLAQSFDNRETYLDACCSVIPGLGKLFKKPWWLRMWVVQEVIASKSWPLVGCGHIWVSWEAVSRFIFRLTTDEVATDISDLQDIDIMSSLEFIISSLAGKDNFPGKALTLEDLLISTSNRHARDPKDQIFAILGLISNPGSETLIPDYELPIDHIYQRAVIDVFRSTNDLDFLVNAISQPTQKLPSWCVDFSTTDWYKEIRELGWYRLDGSRPKGASGPTLRSTIVN